MIEYKKTTFIRKRGEMPHHSLPKCHDGVGDLDFTEVLGGEANPTRRLNFFHDDILAPGVSVGVHHHEHDEEYYYIVSGTGIMTLDGKEHPVQAGDITAVFPGGSHGLANNSNANLRIIVVSVLAEKS